MNEVYIVIDEMNDKVMSVHDNAEDACVALILSLEDSTDIETLYDFSKEDEEDYQDGKEFDLTPYRLKLAERIMSDLRTYKGFEDFDAEIIVMEVSSHPPMPLEDKIAALNADKERIKVEQDRRKALAKLTAKEKQLLGL